MAPKKSSTTNVWFKYVEVKSKVIYTSTGSACYYDITSRALARSVKFIRTWIDPIYSQYTEPEVVEWCAMMNRIGFPVMYKGLNEKEGYVFVLAVAKYKQKLHLSSALMILRYLWESYLDDIPKHFFKIMKEVEDISEWDALQLAHQYMNTYGNTNHSLRDNKPRSFVSKEHIESLYKDCCIYNDGRAPISYSWGSDYGMDNNIYNDAPATYKERYKFLKAKS